MYGLTSQIRRAAASVPANIAEGCGRDSDPEIARFSRIALGSANELEYHLLLARDLEFLPSADHESLAEAIRQVKHMLARPIARISTDSRRPTTDDHYAV